MTCEIYMVQSCQLNHLFLGPLLYMSVCRCWENVGTMGCLVCVLYGRVTSPSPHRGLHKQWRPSVETHNNNSSHFLVNLQHITAQLSFHIGRKCEQEEESSLKPASAKMCVAGGASNEPSWRLKFYHHGEEKALHGVLNVKALVRCFQPGEGPSRGLLRDCWL